VPGPEHLSETTPSAPADAGPDPEHLSETAPSAPAGGGPDPDAATDTGSETERLAATAPRREAPGAGTTASAATPPPPPPPPTPPAAPAPGIGPPASLGAPPAPPAPPVARPRLDDRERWLDPRMVRVWRTFAALRQVPLLVLASVGWRLIGDWGWVLPVAVLVLMAFSLGWYQPARYRRWRWRLTDLALDLRHGVLVHRRETVPYFRIQQIDVIQGPVDRWLRLATLAVTTASASGSVALPGIPADDAPAVRAELLGRAAQAVGDHPGEVADAV
jgi:uncharacterized protein